MTATATNSRTVSTGYHPRPIQREIHKAMSRHRFGVIVAHRRFGKTVFCVNALIDAALRCKKKNPRFAYIAPFYRQAKDVAWQILQDHTEAIPQRVVSQAELSVTLPNGGRVRLYGADNPDSLRGIYLDGLVVDEVADLRPNVWGEVLRPALADRKGWAIFIGTPRGINLFSELYYAAVEDPAWFAGHYPVSRTGILDADELAMIRATSTDSQYAQEMECDFNAAVDNALIPLDLVLRASGKHMALHDVAGAPKVLGVDVARYGDDRSVIFPRQGLVAFKPRVVRGVNNMDLAGMVAAAIDKWKPDAVMVDAGRGEGVIDRLRQLGHEVHEVNFGGKAGDPHYVNKRAEMWDSMRRWLEAGACIPNMVELKTDLCAPTYSYANAANRFELESKDKMKERGLSSPDVADALALTFAHPVAPRPIELRESQPRGSYNPIRDRLNVAKSPAARLN